MPELPEVETVRRGLERYVCDQTISVVECIAEKSCQISSDEIDRHVIGSRIVAVRRRAKVLICDLSSGYSLLVHLKMTGQLVYVGSERFGAGHPNDSLIGALPDSSTRVMIQFVRGGVLYFNDQRRFGWMRLFPTVELESVDVIRRLGPEPLHPDFTANMFIERLRRRNNSGVKAVLLDQSIVAGVGNIYADESLWGAKIHPLQKIRDISDAELNVLWRELVEVMNLAIKMGGSTDKNYVNAEGKRGSYLTFARVFRREGLLCSRCGSTIQKIRVAGRGTHICPECQVIRPDRNTV